MNFVTMGAIAKRDLVSFFTSLKGYVFVLAFVILAVTLAFRPDTREFFTNNRATLDLLNKYFPLLLVFFVPAITMSAWAQERGQGTEQLLFTLPVHDHEIVLAKFAACLGVYSVALLFTTANVGVLDYLGSPDWGLIFANYVGYLLIGSAAIALAMLGSSLTTGLTTAWLLGAVFVGIPAIPYFLPASVDLTATGSALARLQQLWNALGAPARFQSFNEGVISLSDVVYFVALTGVALYANAVVLGRRHWTIERSRAVHGAVRLACLTLCGVCLTALAVGAAARADVTAAKMLSVRPEALRVLDRLREKDDKGVLKVPPVLVQAWISPVVPEPFIPVREGLIRLLNELDSRGGDQVRVAIYETELYSKEAQRAEQAYGIKPRRVPFGRGSEEIFLGLAFTCGPREFKIPFFDKGLPIQYELVHAIGSVAKFERRKVGVIKSGVDLFGGFDFQNMSSRDDWEVLADLRKQYDVEKVEATAPISSKIDVLVVPLPSSLPQEEMDNVLDYLYAGGKALVLCDPFPYIDLNLAPLRPAGGQQNPFGPRKPPSKPKGDVEGFMKALGVTWPKDRIVWDSYNPHVKWQDLPREIAIVGPENPSDPEHRSGFADHSISKGLQELIFLYGGELAPGDDKEISFTPLLSTRTVSGYHSWHDMVSETFMGVRPKDASQLDYKTLGERRTLAAVLEGKLAARKAGPALAKGQRSAQPFKAVVMADLDAISDMFYTIRRQGSDDSSLELDNVTFVSNAIDWLAGDDTYIELRKLRPKHRTLEVFEKVRKETEEQQRKVAEEAKADAKKKLEEAQKRLDEAVDKIRNDKKLDPRQADVLIMAAQERENRRLGLEKAKIEDEQNSKIRLSRTEAQQKIRAKEDATMRWARLAVVAFALFPGVLVLWHKASLEGATMDPARRRKA
ncbi:MAG: Gldg family protein [Planctomycetota bacterium]